MATINNLISKTSKYLTSEQVSDIKSAFSFAEKSHKGQFRASGEPFIQHPLKTAIYLSNLRLDSEAISAALLHDVVEDCGINENQIRKVKSDVEKIIQKAVEFSLSSEDPPDNELYTDIFID